jgi:hypothetical protein
VSDISSINGQEQQNTYGNEDISIEEEGKGKKRANKKVSLKLKSGSF